MLKAVVDRLHMLLMTLRYQKHLKNHRMVIFRNSTLQQFDNESFYDFWYFWRVTC